MKNDGKRYAEQILPLLRSIAREIQDRTTAIAHGEESMRSLAATGHRNDEVYRSLVADVAVQKRELRHVMSELEHLGCSLEPDSQLTFRIQGRSGQPHHAYTWRPGGDSLELAPLEEPAA